MPLPVNSTLSVLNPSRPGDARPQKPKQAMLIRLTSDTLDALEGHNSFQFQFGDSPGIQVGDAYFPMAQYEETTINELYLRASSATKKTAPLKLYANVVGKFAVEQREIANELRDRIRESTLDAAAQKNSRNIVVVDTPLDIQPTGKKRKDTMFRPRPKPQQRPAAPTPAPTHKPTLSTSSSATQSQREGLVSLRKRFVRCLAHSDKSEEQLCKMLGAPDRNSSLRADVLYLLEQLAELNKSGKLYTLKPVVWKEVRPFEWPGLSEQERINMARTARSALTDLRVPETDPIWRHFQSKATNANSSENNRPSSSNPSTEDKPPKRGISSQEVREKKLKPMAEPKAETRVRAEGQRASPRPQAEPKTETRVRAEGQRPSPRPQAESKAEVRVRAESQRASPRPETPNDSRRGTDQGRDNRKQPSSSSKPTKPSLLGNSSAHREKTSDPRQEAASSSVVQSHERSLASHKAKKLRRESGINGSDSERERAPSKAKERPSRRDVDDGDYVDSKASSRRRAPEVEYGESKSASKRKAIDADDDAYDSQTTRHKKRKTEQHSISSSVSQDDRARRRESTLPRKPNVDLNDLPARSSSAIPKINKATPPPTVRRNPSASVKDSLEAPAPSRSNSSTGSSSRTSKANQPAKSRRRSPIYTSSSEEDDKDEVASAKRPPTTNTISHSTSRTNSSRPLPTDHASLRARYNTCYVDYVTTLQTLLVQKEKNERLMKAEGRSGSMTESDGDVELLPADELQNLRAKHQRHHDELGAIQKIFAKVETGSD